MMAAVNDATASITSVDFETRMPTQMLTAQQEPDNAAALIVTQLGPFCVDGLRIDGRYVPFSVFERQIESNGVIQRYGDLAASMRCGTIIKGKETGLVRVDLLHNGVVVDTYSLPLNGQSAMLALWLVQLQRGTFSLRASPMQPHTTLTTAELDVVMTNVEVEHVIIEDLAARRFMATFDRTSDYLANRYCGWRVGLLTSPSASFERPCRPLQR
jgi:hypothetical protein